jgi:hypothetical protein
LAASRLRTIWFRGLARAGYRRLILLECRADDLLRQHTGDPSALVTELRESDWKQYSLSTTVSLEEMKRRHQAGHSCVVLQQDGVVLSGSWFARGPGAARIAYLDSALPLASDEVYHYDGFTAPAARKLGLASAAQLGGLRLMFESGVRLSLTTVLPENRAGLGVCRKLGYHPVATIGYVRLGPWLHSFRLPRSG